MKQRQSIGRANGATFLPALARLAVAPVFALIFALIFLPAASGVLRAGEAARLEPDIDMFASMAGKCSTMKLKDRTFVCTTVAFFHSPGGRSSFTVPLNDPNDDSHIISFSGEISSRVDDRYELSIDRMLLNSRDRPKADGLPVPAVVSSRGTCSQIGKLSEHQVSSISCSATDANGVSYELRFESDGSPVRVMNIKVSDLADEEQRARVRATHVEQLKCRQMAYAQGVRPRDRTAFILRCMEE
jgi:hypothetical protein